MKRFLFPLLTLSILACGDSKKQIDVAGISPSPFIGYWEIATDNDSIKKLSLYIGERNDSLLVAFYWERKNPDYITESPFKDSNGDIIPHACLATPKSGNTANGEIVNQYFSVYNLYPQNEYYNLVLELKKLDTLTYKIKGKTNYWPESATLVRRSNSNVLRFSTATAFKENYLIPDVDVNKHSNFNLAGITPTPFIGKWSWVKNGPWNSFNIRIGERNDALLIAMNGVFFGGRKIQPSEYDEKERLIPQARIATPKSGNTANGTFANSRMNHFYGTDSCNYAISLELKSNNTLIFKTEKPIGNCPDSAVMVRIDDISPVFTDDLSHFYK